jgi:hypothetical protein
MALSKPNLEDGWISRVLAEPEKSLSEITAGAYNPYLIRTAEWENPQDQKEVVNK